MKIINQKPWNSSFLSLAKKTPQQQGLAVWHGQLRLQVNLAMAY